MDVLCLPTHESLQLLFVQRTSLDLGAGVFQLLRESLQFCNVLHASTEPFEVVAYAS